MTQENSFDVSSFVVGGMGGSDRFVFVTKKQCIIVVNASDLSFQAS